jgi:hypothetical protein
MIPEAFEESHAIAGVVAVAGFLVAFALSKAASSAPAAADCEGGSAARSANVSTFGSASEMRVRAR